MSKADDTNREEKENQEGQPTPELLREAFDVFSKASSQLEQSYNELKERADRLAKELAITNAELQKQLAEKEQISNFLENILLSIPSGIIVFSETGEIAMSNGVARNIFGDQLLEEGAAIDDVIAHKPLLEFVRSCAADASGKTFSREFELVGSASGKPGVINIGCAPVVNKEGTRVASLLVAQDVSRIKELEDQAMRTNRLAAMGEMAAQLAHEIRNPLGSIEIFASLLGRDLRGTDNQKLADNIVVGVKSLNAVVTNMLTFTRSINVNPEPLEVNELVDETIGFLEHVLTMESIELEMKLDDETGRAELDPELMKQVLLNLAQNAVFAMESASEPQLTVTTGRSDHEDGRRGVEISITDNGCGMPEQELKKIFDPFYSTRKGGTGLGLSVVSQIVEKHHGVIVPESVPGEGTTMRLWLPANLT
jgi:signal transduction histidine kinase